MPTPDYMLGATPVKADMAPDYMRGATPVADLPGAAVVNSAAPLSPPLAAKALDAAASTGFSPDFVSANLDDVLKEKARSQLALGLDASPTLKSWAARSTTHAAALDPADVKPLGTIEQWLGGFRQGFLDIGSAEAMREYMGGGGPLKDYALSAEQATLAYDAQPHGYGATIARAAPQMAMYAAAGTLTGSAGLAALMYVQNKGVLARQIQQAMPEAPEGDEPDNRLTDEEVDKYATAGSLAASVTLAGLIGPLVRSLPGARETIQDLAGGVMARAAATTVGRAALRALLAYGGHTAAGALGMALQSTINSATVKKALGEDADIPQLTRETLDNFVRVLPVAATFAAYGPARDFLEDRGRINAAGGDAAKLNEMVAQAKTLKTSPPLLTELFGLMGRGAKVFIDWRAAQKVQNLNPAAVAEAQATQGHVAVPIADYLAHPDEHEGVKEDVKLDANGYTPREAQARDKEMRQALSPEDARALYGALPMDELQGLDMPISEDLSPETVRELSKTNPEEKPGTAAARPGNVIPKTEVHAADSTVEAKPLHEAMAEEYGGTPEAWAEKLTPELLDALNEEKSVGAVAPEEHAARIINALPIGDIDPKPFKRMADRASKSIQKVAEQAVTAGPTGAKASSPRDVAILSTHELARDLNLAKAKRAEEVQAEMQKGRDNLAKQAVNQKLRVQLNRAGGPLLHLFDALTEGASVSPQRQGWVDAHNEAVSEGKTPFSPEASAYADARMSGAMDEARSWFTDNARSFMFDENGLAAFLAHPKPWEQLTPPEARNILDAVKQLTTAAREEAIIRSGDEKAGVREVADEIRGELRQNPDKGLPLASGVPSTWQQDRLLDANAANALMLRPKNNLRQKSAAALKWIFDRINQAVYARDTLFREVGALHQDAFEAIPTDIAAHRYDTYDLSDKLPVQGLQPMTNVPRQWVWKLARHWGSAGNVDRIISTSGWSKDVLSNILFDDPQTKLSIPEWDYLQSLGDINEQHIWPKVRDHFDTYYGAKPPKIAAVPFRVKAEDGTWKDYAGGYEPLKRDARPGVAPQAEPTRGISQYWGKDFQLPWTPGSVKERVDNSHYLVNMDWDTGQANVAQVLHWLAFDQPVRDVAKLLNDQGLAADMNQYMGQGRADQTRAWLKSSATRQANSVQEGSELVARAFGAQRRLALMGIVGGSARLAVAQLSHPFGLMLGGEVNPVHGLPALLSTFKPLTLENGEVRLFPNWNDALQGAEVQHRAENAYSTLRRTFGEVGQSGNRGPLGRLKDIALGTAGLYLHAVDRLTTTWAWNSFHNEAVSKRMEPFSPEAMDYANGRTQDVMPVHDIETAAPILTNRQMGGFLIMHGFKNTLYNLRADEVNASVLDFHRASTPQEYGGAVWRTAGRVALQAAMFGGFSIMGKLALGYGQQEDETKGQWLSRDAIAGQTVDLPLIGGLGEPLAKLAAGGKVSRRDFTTYSNPAIAGINKAMDLLGNLVSEGREDSKKAFDVLETALFELGLPSRPVRTGSEDVYNVVTGEDFDPGDTGGKFFYTDKQWESIKRSLSPDED